MLVAYFSATGNTENIAEHLVSILDADLYEIVPQVPYTSEDLNYSNDDCRANQEQNDPTARPSISGNVENMEDYDVIFLGYPIWWGDAPKIISTFLETYDFDGKTHRALLHLGQQFHRRKCIRPGGSDLWSCLVGRPAVQRLRLPGDRIPVGGLSGP